MLELMVKTSVESVQDLNFRLDMDLTSHPYKQRADKNWAQLPNHCLDITT